MKFDFYQITSAGDRKSNQDYMAHIINDNNALFVVADGLGGYQAGKRASGYFCQGLIGLAPKYMQTLEDVKNPLAVVKSWIDAAIDEMAGLFGDDSAAGDAHTTCAILYINDSKIITAHCGDSRIYRMTADAILWRTKDHSMTQRLLDRGQIGELEMGFHPGQSKLTRSISINKAHSSEIKVHEASRPGETFVLCTDGFWSSIKEYELLRLAQPESGRKDLLKQAKTSYLRAEGKSDNLTAQWIRRIA